jgi:hypothetical protein
VSGTVQVNKGPAGGDRLDWTEVTGPGHELETVTLVMDATTELAVAGTVWVDLYGFLQCSADFALSKFSTTVTLAGQSTSTNVDVLTFGLHDVNVFVGAGPYYNSDGTLHADHDDAIGLSLENVSLALALSSAPGDPARQLLTPSAAFAQDNEFVGLDDLGDAPVDASGYRIEVNGGGNGAINFAAGVGSAHDVFEVTTGPSTSFSSTIGLHCSGWRSNTPPWRSATMCTSPAAFPSPPDGAGCRVERSRNGPCQRVRVRRQQRGSVRR